RPVRGCARLLHRAGYRRTRAYGAAPAGRRPAPATRRAYGRGPATPGDTGNQRDLRSGRRLTPVPAMKTGATNVAPVFISSNVIYPTPKGGGLSLARRPQASPRQ